MNATQIKALANKEVLSKYKLYKDLKSRSFKDEVILEMLAIEIDLRKI